MAKLTLAGLAALVRAQVDAELIANQDYSFDRNTITNLLVKIGKQVINDSDFTDRLEELEGEDLPYGTTIEEYFVNLITPVDYDPDGSTNMAPSRATFENPFYSKELNRKTVKNTVDDSKYENAMISAEAFNSLVATIIKRLHDSFTVYKYQLKKQMVGEMISRVPEASTVLKTIMPIPNDVASGELFIKSVKEKEVLLAQFLTENNNLNGTLARAPELVLYVRGEKVLPSIDVDVLAGAFHQDKVAIPVKVKSLEDFGTLTDNPDTWAILLDPRGIRVHAHNLTAKSDVNGEGEFTNYYLHYTPIGYMSYHTNLHIWST